MGEADTAIKAPVTQVVVLVAIPAAARAEDILVADELLQGQDHLDPTLCLRLGQRQTRAIDDLSLENDENCYVNFFSSKKIFHIGCTLNVLTVFSVLHSVAVN